MAAKIPLSAEDAAALAYYRSPGHAQRLSHDLLRQLLIADNALRQLSTMAPETIAGAFSDERPGTHDFSPATPRVCAEARSVLAFVHEIIRGGELHDGLHQLALLADRIRRHAGEHEHLPNRGDILRALIAEASWWFQENHGLLEDRATKGHLPGLVEGAAEWIIRGLLRHSRAFDVPAETDAAAALEAVKKAAESKQVLDATGKLDADFLENLVLESLVGLGLSRNDARNKLGALRQEQERGGLKRKA